MRLVGLVGTWKEVLRLSWRTLRSAMCCAIFNIFIATWYKQKQRKKEKETTTAILDTTKTLPHRSKQSFGPIRLMFFVFRRRRVGILINMQVTANNTVSNNLKSCNRNGIVWTEQENGMKLYRSRVNRFVPWYFDIGAVLYRYRANGVWVKCSLRRVWRQRSVLPFPPVSAFTTFNVREC